jgi:hypothetical protein
MEESDVQSVLDAATRAAASSNWTTAEQCLRLALRMQEVTLGPSHPELARTLGNLGSVCEVSRQITAAETCYRKALKIAAAALVADHPLVLRTRDNLRQFCAANDLPLDL